MALMTREQSIEYVNYCFCNGEILQVLYDRLVEICMEMEYDG